MKKLLLLTTAIVTGISGFAQSSFQSGQMTFKGTTNAKTSVISDKINMDEVLAGKSTATSDTFINFLPLTFRQQIFDSAAYYVLGTLPADSGAFFGPNTSGFNGFAEWYNPGTYLADTTMEIVGALSRWGGTVQSGSTKTIAYKMWSVDAMAQVQSDSDRFITEIPGTVMYTQNANITSFLLDTALTVQLFNTPQPVTAPFFLGYEPNFPFAPAGGDTIGLYSSRNGYSWFHGAIDTQINNGGGDIDTVFFAQTCFRTGTTWQDVWVSRIASVNLSIMPLYRFEGGNVFPVGVEGLTHKNLKVYGNYPNPATNNTNISFGLASSTDVKVQVLDMTGRTLSTSNFGTMAAGTHEVAISTAELPSGNYIYLLSTSKGGTLAVQFTVAH